MPAKPLRRPQALVILPEGHTIYDMADACEEAAAEILAPTSERWGALELSGWLCGAYEIATQHTSSGKPQELNLLRNDAEVRELLRTTRAFVTSELETARVIGLDAALATAIERQIVVRACDSTGQGGFLPSGRAEMTLIDRVMSLLAASYLSRPTEHEVASGIREKASTNRIARGNTILGLGSLNPPSRD